MGKFRNCEFENVIGVGGIGSEPRAAGISGKVNWIGVGAKKVPLPGARGPSITFKHFRLYEEEGPDFKDIAPMLARRLYSNNVRLLLNLNKGEQEEVDQLLEMAKASSSSTGTVRPKGIRCPPRKCC